MQRVGLQNNHTSPGKAPNLPKLSPCFLARTFREASDAASRLVSLPRRPVCLDSPSSGWKGVGGIL